MSDPTTWTRDELLHAFRTRDEQLTTARADRDRLAAEVERLRVYEPSLRKFEVHENGAATAEIRVPHEFRQTLALNLAAVLADAKAVNYIETQVVHPEQGMFAMTIQRCAGKTPGQVATEEKAARAAAEAEAERLRGVLREVLDAPNAYAYGIAFRAARAALAPRPPHVCVNPAAEDRSPVLVHDFGPDCKGEDHATLGAGSEGVGGDQAGGTGEGAIR